MWIILVKRITGVMQIIHSRKWIFKRGWFLFKSWLGNSVSRYVKMNQHPWMNYQTWLSHKSELLKRVNELDEVSELVAHKISSLSDCSLISSVPVINHARKLLVILGCGLVVGWTPLKNSILASWICLIQSRCFPNFI